MPASADALRPLARFQHRSRLPSLLAACCLIAGLSVGGCSHSDPPTARPSVAAPPQAPAPSAPSDPGTASSDASPAASQTISLFNGKDLTNWEVTQFGTQGDIDVEDGHLVIGFGDGASGVTWKGPDILLKNNYEIELEAQRVDGNDFFCGLTFPVEDSHCSLIVGGWGGGLVGLSSLNGFDASDNETGNWHKFEKGRWYKIRLRVATPKIEAWIDDMQVIDCDIAGRKVGIRPEVELSRPLGICTWRTTAALKNIRLRSLK